MKFGEGESKMSRILARVSIHVPDEDCDTPHKVDYVKVLKGILLHTGIGTRPIQDYDTNIFIFPGEPQDELEHFAFASHVNSSEGRRIPFRTLT